MAVELITNGTFDSDVSGWSDGSTGSGVAPAWLASWPPYTGVLRLQVGGAPGTSRADQSIVTTAGTQYQLTWDAANYQGAATVEVGTSQGDDSISSTLITAAGSYSTTFTATGSTTWIGIEQQVTEVATYYDNVSCQVFFGGGYWQSQKGLACKEDPTKVMGDNAYRELIRAKGVAQQVDGLLADIYTYMVNAHEQIADVNMSESVGYVDATILEEDVFTQGERYRLNLHGPHAGGTAIVVPNWTFEYLPFTQHLETIGSWTISDTTIDGEPSKILRCDTADFCWLPRTHWDGLTAGNAAYGTWEWWIYKDPAGAPIVMPIASQPRAPGDATQDGYSISISAAGVLALNDVASGVPGSLFTTAASTISDDTWTKITMTRTSGNVFTVYIDDVAATAATGSNPVTDATWTESEYIVCDLDATDAVGLCTFQTDNNDILLWSYDPL